MMIFFSLLFTNNNYYLLFMKLNEIIFLFSKNYYNFYFMIYEILN